MACHVEGKWVAKNVIEMLRALASRLCASLHEKLRVLVPLRCPCPVYCLLSDSVGGTKDLAETSLGNPRLFRVSSHASTLLILLQAVSLPRVPLQGLLPTSFGAG